MSNCYFCAIDDPNEVHFDPEHHEICFVCAVKLWEVGQHRLEFEMRDHNVIIDAIKKSGVTSDARSVSLSTGYEVDLADREDFNHLFNAVLGEVMNRLKAAGVPIELHDVHDVGICELHYVAGRLHQAGQDVDLALLLDAFETHWRGHMQKLKDADEG